MSLRPSAVIGAAILLAALAATLRAILQYSPPAMHAEDVQILRAFPPQSVQQLAVSRDVLLRYAESNPVVVWSGWFCAYVAMQVGTAMGSILAIIGAHWGCRLLTCVTHPSDRPALSQDRCRFRCLEGRCLVLVGVSSSSHVSMCAADLPPDDSVSVVALQRTSIVSSSRTMQWRTWWDLAHALGCHRLSGGR